MFAEAFVLWGAPTTWLEVIAFVLALAMVGCNIREIHWGWPLAAISSVLYCTLFWRSKLYGDAALQVFFALVALWGWTQWLRGRRDDGGALLHRAYRGPGRHRPSRGLGRTARRAGGPGDGLTGPRWRLNFRGERD